MSWRNSHLKVLRENYLLDQATDAERVEFFKLGQVEAEAFIRSRCGCHLCKGAAQNFTPHGRDTFSNILRASLHRQRHAAGSAERARRRTIPD